MRLPRSCQDFSDRFRIGDLRRNHSGTVSSLPGEGEFHVNGDATLRYHLDQLGLEGAPLFFVAMQVTLRGGAARANVISVVNGDVTDGRIWPIRPADATGTHCLTAVLRASDNDLIVYVNTEGEGDVLFRIDRLLVTALDNTPLRMGFVIGPWIERGVVRWKDQFLWWFANLSKALRHAGYAVEERYAIGSGVALSLGAHYVDPSASVHIIPAQALAGFYESQRAGLRDQRQRLEAGAPDGRRLYAARLGQALGDACDVVFSLDDNQLLHDVCPRALILYRDAIHGRAPFPDEMNGFDIAGLGRNAGYAKWCATPAPRRLPESFIERFLPRDPHLAALLVRRGLSQGGFLLLPLQESSYWTFYDESPFADQIDLILAALGQFPDQPIVVTQHPASREIEFETLTALEALYPNIIYLPELAALDNPSAQLLPFSGGLVAVSTGLIHQALMCGVPVHLLGTHPLSGLLEGGSSGAHPQDIAWHLVTRMFASYRYLLDGNWLMARLVTLALVKSGALDPDYLAIDLPENVLASLEESARPFSPSKC